jgi:hypothetical protein
VGHVEPHAQEVFCGPWQHERQNLVLLCLAAWRAGGKPRADHQALFSAPVPFLTARTGRLNLTHPRIGLLVPGSDTHRDKCLDGKDKWRLFDCHIFDKAHTAAGPRPIQRPRRKRLSDHFSRYNRRCRHPGKAPPQTSPTSRHSALLPSKHQTPITNQSHQSPITNQSHQSPTRVTNHQSIPVFMQALAPLVKPHTGNF